MRREFLLSVISMVMKIEAFNNFADTSCGIQNNTNFIARVVGGENALRGEFPWIVSITRRGGHFCGGTVINNRFIMTAAHCLCTGIDNDIVKPGQIKVTLAQHDLSNKNSDAYQMVVKSCTIHPGYTCNKPKDDIAILELEDSISWSQFVVPACLPDGMDHEKYTKFEDVLATVAGWGWTNEDHSKGKRSNILQKARVNVIELEKCKMWFKSQGKKTKLQENQMCAGYEQGGIDACWADSGGPLMAKTKGENKQMMVIGVVSTGIGCARPNLPGLYTRVSNYIPWIREVIGQ